MLIPSFDRSPQQSTPEANRPGLTKPDQNKEIIYEQPLNERIRTMLRLENLFHHADHTMLGGTVWDSRAGLRCLLDILNIFGRSDLKTEVIKELERISSKLAQMEKIPGVDSSKLADLLDNLDTLLDQMHTIHCQIGAQLKQNEFLCSIKQRISIAGGTCDFDLPAYHHWLAQDADTRNHDLQQWHAQYAVIRAAIELILRLTRESASSTEETAESGCYQEALDKESPYQMIRVSIPMALPYYAEISGGKHRITLRFMEVNYTAHPHQTENSVDFTITRCLL